MKKTVISFLILYSGLCNAQNWCPSGAEWNYTVDAFGGGSYLKYTYQKDTLVKEQACKKIIGIGIKLIYGPPGVPPKITDTVSLGPYFTYSKNDTVYFYKDNAFLPIYYFNAKVGDTLLYSEPVTQWSGPVQQLVDSTGNIIINGISLRYYCTHNIDSDIYPHNTKVIERIGVLDNSFLPAYYSAIVEVDENLLCYTDDSFLVYKRYPNVSCEFVSAVTNKADDNLLIINPNPAEELINVSCNPINKIEKINIYDISGKLLIPRYPLVQDTMFSIDVKGLPNGMYYLQILTDKRKTITKKFIKIYNH